MNWKLLCFAISLRWFVSIICNNDFELNKFNVEFEGKYASTDRPNYKQYNDGTIKLHYRHCPKLQHNFVIIRKKRLCFHVLKCTISLKKTYIKGILMLLPVPHHGYDGNHKLMSLTP